MITPNPIVVSMTVLESAQRINMSVVSTAQQYSVGVASAINVIGGTPFSGPYEITPAQETQTLRIAGLKATQDITVNPIPSNYGLITWNGAVITVS